MTKKRIFFLISTLILLGIEILIGLFAHGFVRNNVGDILVVILIYCLVRTITPYVPGNPYILPVAILIFAFGVEFLQLWGFCDKFGIENRLLRIIIGTGFSVTDLISYFVGVVACYFVDAYTLKINF